MKHKILGWVSVFIGLFVIILAFCVDKDLFPLPVLLYATYNNTDANALFFTLLQVHATVVGLPLAAIALLSNVLDKKVYGYPVSKFIMSGKQIWPLKQGSIIIQLIFSVLVAWFAVEYQLFNVAIAIFVITIALLTFLLAKTIKNLHYTIKTEEQIKGIIIENGDIEDLKNLLGELLEALGDEKTSIINKDTIVLKKFIEKNLPKKCYNKKWYTDLIQEIISLIIKAADSENANSCYEALKIVNSLYDTANGYKPIKTVEDILANSKQEKRLIIPLGFLNYYEFFQLIRLIKPSKKSDNVCISLNNNVMNNIVFNGETNEIESDKYATSISASIYHCIKENKNFNEKQKQDLFWDMLKYTNLDFRKEQKEKEDIFVPEKLQQQNLWSKSIEPRTVFEVKEQNYVSYVIALLKGKEGYFDSIIGIGKKESFMLNPLISQYNRLVLNRADLFIIIYCYYLAFYEDETLVASLTEGAEKYKNVLARINAENVYPSFLDAFSRLWQGDNEVDIIGKIKAYFYFALSSVYKHELFYFDEDGTSSKTVVCHYAVYDFFVFAFANIFDKDMLKKAIDAIYEDTISGAMHSYCNEGKEAKSYKSFCDSFLRDIVVEERKHENYETLKSVIKELYREKEQITVAETSDKFDRIKDQYEEKTNRELTQIIDEYISKYAVLEINEETDFQHKDLFVLTTPIFLQNGEVVTSVESVKNHITYYITRLIYHIIEGRFYIEKKDSLNVNVDVFLKICDEIKPNAQSGLNIWKYRKDGNFEKFKEISESYEDVPRIYDNLILFLDMSKIKVSVKNVKAKISLLETEEIESRIKEGNYVDVSGHLLPFITKKDAAEYISNHYRKVNFSLDIAVQTTQDMVGKGIEIVEEDKAEKKRKNENNGLEE